MDFWVDTEFVSSLSPLESFLSMYKSGLDGVMTPLDMWGSFSGD